MILYIFGDSFANLPQGDGFFWSNELRNKLLPVSYKNYARVGTSIWYSYNLFTEVLDSLVDSDEQVTVIFTCTDFARIPYLPEQMVEYSNRYSEWKSQIDGLHQILKTYFYNFHNEKYLAFVYASIIKELITKCKDNNINLILLAPFENPMLPNNTIKDDTSENFVSSIASTKVPLLTGLWHYALSYYPIPNHMLPEQHRILANLLFDIIQDYENQLDKEYCLNLNEDWIKPVSSFFAKSKNKLRNP